MKLRSEQWRVESDKATESEVRSLKRSAMWREPGKVERWRDTTGTLVYVDAARMEQLMGRWALPGGGEWMLLRSEQRLKLALREKAKEAGTPGMSRYYPIHSTVARHVPRRASVIGAAIFCLSILASSLALHASQNPAPSQHSPGTRSTIHRSRLD